MNSNKRRQQDLNLDAVLRYILEPEGPAPRVSEELLWAYALGALQLPEREQVMQQVARSEEVQQRLQQIEESVTVASRPSEVSVLDTARQRAADVLAKMGEDIASVAAVILDTGDRLVSASADLASGEPEVAAAPATLGPNGLGAEGGVPGEVSGQKIEKRGPKGLTVVIVRTPNGKIDLHVRLSEAPTEGDVRLLKLVLKEGAVEEQETYLDQPLRNGRAVLKGCPHGEYKIIAPGGRQMVLCLASGRR